MPGALSNVPGLGGFLESEQLGQQQQMGQLQQMTAVQGILAKQQAMQEEQQLRGVLSQSGGDPAKAVQALVQTGTPTSLSLAAKLHSLLPNPDGRFSEAGNGILNTRTGQVNPNPHAKPAADKGTWSEPYNMNGAMVQKNTLTGEIRTAVTRQPNISVRNEPPVTPVTIADPDDPTGRNTIIIDGRTRKVLGKGPKMTQAGAIDAKAELSLTGLGADLQAAEDLLTGVTRTSDGQIVKGNLPTGSGIGSIYDAAAGFIGASPAGAAEADSLKTVAARLVGRIPRFEGPQSNNDVQLYKQAAGDVGNEKLPIPRRLAAARTMRQIYAGYESGQRGRLIGNRRASDKAGSADEPPPGAVRPRR